VKNAYTHIVTSARLSLRHFTDNDTEFLVQLLNTESWLKFIGDRNVHNEQSAQQYLQRSAYKAIASHGYAMMRVAIKESDTPIGMCGLFKREELDLPDLGFALLPEFEGLGFAYEASEAVLEHAQETLGISEVYAITNDFNERSIALLKRLGFKHTEQRYNKEFEEYLELYKREATSRL
jgi:[ribosomal protein S5]-alanine N-acetyltransferase